MHLFSRHNVGGPIGPFSPWVPTPLRSADFWKYVPNKKVDRYGVDRKYLPFSLKKFEYLNCSFRCALHKKFNLYPTPQNFSLVEHFIVARIQYRYEFYVFINMTHILEKLYAWKIIDHLLLSIRVSSRTVLSGEVRGSPGKSGESPGTGQDLETLKAPAPKSPRTFFEGPRTQRQDFANKVQN